MAASSSSGGGGNGSTRIMSVVEDQGVYSSNCGYCKSRRKSSVSHGLWAHRLTVDDYQELLDRGWRRSGMHLYKPDCSKTCCPPYTIRLEADKFVPSKEQKRVRRRMNRYLEGGREGTEAPGEQSSKSEQQGIENMDFVDELSAGILVSLKEVIGNWVTETGISDFQIPEITVRRISEKLRKHLRDTDGEAHYTSNAAFLVASAVKRRKQKQGDDDKSDLSPAEIAISLAAKLRDEQHFVRSGNIAKPSKGHINFYFSSSSSSSFQNCVAVEVTAEQAESSNGRVSNEERLQRTLEVRMHRSAFDPEEFQLYKRYQVAVHNDRPEQLKESSYRRFLVESPLVPVQAGSISYGSFHQQYRIDGRLVAVGVVDILPKCLSSKYLFWDPDFAFLSLGKFSALQEIEWVQRAHQSSSTLQYYYLGYYIHSCPKMRYKAAYYPSELLCPLNFRWVFFDTVRPLVETGASVCISDVKVEGKNSAGVDDDSSSEKKALGDVPILLSSSRCVLLKDLEAAALAKGSQFLSGIKSQLFQYWQLVGSHLASRMAYFLQPKPCY